MKQSSSKTSITHYLIFFTAMIFSSTNFAKRTTPSDVQPIQFQDVEYRVIKFPHEDGTTQNGGYVEARRISDGKKLWGHLIYKTQYTHDLEKDVQEVFIKSMHLGETKEYLVITNENNETFHVYLKDGKSQKQ
jgi:hypothetical protein